MAMTVELYLGDCLEIMQELEDDGVDAVITDIPYGTTACSWDEVIPFDEMWEQVKRVTDVFITTASQPFTSKLVMSNLDWFKYEWIWTKNTTSNFALAKKQPLRNHENILVFYSGQPTYNPIKELRDLNPESKKRMEYEFTSIKGENVHQGGLKKIAFIPESKSHRYPTTTKRFHSVPTSNGRVHPTQKPIALYEYLIETYTNEGDTVCDIAMGSGTTGVACVQTGRNFIGIEIEPKYYEIAEKRIKEAQLQIRMEI